jgi:hypothetical protein
MIKKLLAIIVIVVVASLSVAGCTFPITTSPTSTPTPTNTSTSSPVSDYSSYITGRYERINSILEQPFKKVVNFRGNDVYRGVMRNASYPGAISLTIVAELTKSKAEAKQLFDQAITDKVTEGFVSDPAQVLDFKLGEKKLGTDIVEGWYGSNKAGRTINSFYYFDSYMGKWVFTMQTG